MASIHIVQLQGIRIRTEVWTAEGAAVNVIESQPPVSSPHPEIMPVDIPEASHEEVDNQPAEQTPDIQERSTPSTAPQRAPGIRPAAPRAGGPSSVRAPTPLEIPRSPSPPEKEPQNQLVQNLVVLMSSFTMW